MKFFDDLWLAHQPDQNGMVEFWDRRAVSFNAHKDEDEAREHRRLLTDALFARAGLGPESRVLDIGCGPGHYALLLARRVAGVTGFDIAPQMIALAKANAETEGRLNADFEVLDWEAADLQVNNWEKKFQLVLASKTPAVNNLAAMEKMMAASCGCCCLISQVDTQNSVRDQLKGLVDWDEEKTRISRTFYPAFNLLWLMGYYPEVSYLDRNWEGYLSLEDALLIYGRYFESLGALKPAQKENLAAKLRALAADGLIHEEVKSKVAVMFWEV
jgi:SAM-dependent methyltransferase